jgi:hypothetical protein
MACEKTVSASDPLLSALHLSLFSATVPVSPHLLCLRIRGNLKIRGPEGRLDGAEAPVPLPSLLQG